MIKINFLKANNGDSIHISYNSKNIIIDSGTGATYSSKNGNRAEQYGELKHTINEIKNRNEKINLLIITHWDDDHIGGILKWFKEDLDGAKSLIEHIWFNSGTLINQHFDSQKATEKNDILNIGTYDPVTSIRQGIAFEKYILDNNLSNTKIINIDSDVSNSFDDIIFTILSPTDVQLTKLLTLWEKSPYNPNTSSNNDYSKSLEELGDIEFREDRAIHNGSTIAFILEIESKKMLFLGDAHPSVIVDSLNKLCYSEENKLNIELMKVSHHGSKANTSEELLELIMCDNFIISTDGSRHSLPNKESLARIVKKHPNCKIYFNYSNLINRIFTDDELNNSNFEVLDVGELNI